MPPPSARRLPVPPNRVGAGAGLRPARVSLQTQHPLPTRAQPRRGPVRCLAVPGHHLLRTHHVRVHWPRQLDSPNEHPKQRVFLIRCRCGKKTLRPNKLCGMSGCIKTKNRNGVSVPTGRTCRSAVAPRNCTMNGKREARRHTNGQGARAGPHRSPTINTRFPDPGNRYARFSWNMRETDFGTRKPEATKSVGRQAISHYPLPISQNP